MKRKKRLATWKVMLIFLALVAIGVTIIYFVLQNLTYEHAKVETVYAGTSSNNGNYVEYADGVLKYSRDGIAMLTREGKEIWNQSCQMGNPITAVCEDAAVVGDKGGTNMLVFEKEGLKGEIQTTRPIEKISVSAQGIVAVILQNEETPKIMCYDAKGNTLVEFKTSLSTTGYPIALDLSGDGKALAVSYLRTKGNSVSTTVSFYHFDKDVEKDEQHRVATKEYDNTIIPIVSYINDDQILLVSDQSLMMYEGKTKPKEKYTVSLKKEIKSIAYDEKNIVLVLKNSGKTDNELCMYRMNGKKVMSVAIEGEYSHLKTAKNHIFLYDENKCTIYNDTGVCKYSGNMESNIREIFPVSGIQVYMVIGPNGFQKVRLEK